jgi:hypothetical protein
MGSSGGGSSGKIEWPGYMQAVHHQWLNRGGSDSISMSVTQTMNEAFGKSPFEDMIEWVVQDTFGTPAESIWAAFERNKNLDVTLLLTNTLNSLILSGAKQNLMAATNVILDDDLQEVVLPRLRSGMRDINAIQTSSYIFAEGYLESQKQKQLTKLAADIDFKLLDISQSLVSITIDWNKTLVVQSTEIGRLYLAAHLDELKFNTESKGKDRLWDLRVWEYGAHVMSSISGGTAPTGGEESSQVANVLGGAMSGAAMGAQVGATMGAGGYGAAIGAVVGGVAGAFR